jgi:hypothetical protein
MLETRNFLVTITNIVMGAVDFILGARIVLYFLGANPATPFVDWIYSLSFGLTAPFRGLLPDLFLGTTPVDTTALVALTVYSLAAYLVISAIDALTRSAMTTDEEVYPAQEEQIVRRKIVHTH